MAGIRITILLTTLAVALASKWEYVAHTPGALKQGLQGSGVSKDGKTLTVGSVMGQYIVKVNLNNGAISDYVPFNNGMADDEAFGPDGTLAYTSLLEGLVKVRYANGTVKVIAENNPVSPNGVAFDLDGNCYYSQFPAGTGLYKVDIKGVKPQRLITNLPTPMNGFDFGSDNEAYGPFPFTGTVAKTNVNTGATTTIASGFLDPESVRWSADKTKLYVLDTGVNSIFQINPRTGSTTKIVTVPGLTYLDNFRVNGNMFYLSDTVSSSIIQYDSAAKKLSQLTTPNVLALPGGISIVGSDIYIADFVSQKKYNIRSGKVTTIARSGFQTPSTNGIDNSDVSFGIFSVYANSLYSAFSDNFDGRVQIRYTGNNSVAVNLPSDYTTNPAFPYGSYITKNNKIVLFNNYGVGLTVCSGSNFQTCSVVPNFPFVNLTGMAPSGDGNRVYVADYTNGKVFLVDYRTGLYSTVASGLNKPEGLASTSSCDTLFVANTGDKSLVQITRNSVKTVVKNLPIGLTGPNTLPAPYIFTGVAATDDGCVYITSDIEAALIKVNV